jgi:hypothetical protein
MLGGLPEATAAGIAVNIIGTLELVAVAVMLAAILAGVLWFAGRRARRPWRRVLRAGSAILGVLTIAAVIAVGFLVGSP